MKSKTKKALLRTIHVQNEGMKRLAVSNVTRDPAYTNQSRKGWNLSKKQLNRKDAKLSETNSVIRDYIFEKEMSVDLTGLADTDGVDMSEIPPEEVEQGIEVEKEHTKDPEVSLKIAKDHWAETGKGYYPALKQMEKDLMDKNKKEESKIQNLRNFIIESAKSLGTLMRTSGVDRPTLRAAHYALDVAGVKRQRNAIKKIVKKSNKDLSKLMRPNPKLLAKVRKEYPQTQQ